MIDYKAIADADEGLVPAVSNLADACAAIRDISEPSFPERLITYITIANEADMATSGALEAAVDAGITGGTIPKWVRSRLEGSGIDVNDTQVRGVDGDQEKPGLLGALAAGNSVFTNEMAAEIRDMGIVRVYKFSRLKEGHLQNARRWRAIKITDSGDVDEVAELETLKPAFPKITLSELRKVRNMVDGGLI